MRWLSSGGMTSSSTTAHALPVERGSEQLRLWSDVLPESGALSPIGRRSNRSVEEIATPDAWPMRGFLRKGSRKCGAGTVSVGLCARLSESWLASESVHCGRTHCVARRRRRQS
ncbi:hypothetical protein HPB50_023612 [Hyalomma asiaticum]|uniref:Uncharacterized protein n=1 Tax=Hyalomma asiaticum TaxID=266040 RepID=A0ACB7T3R1_HYAAI|nr:hypothetical protein HPB50_023612 [Hyalomma asiaticum]